MIFFLKILIRLYMLVLREYSELLFYDFTIL